MILSIYQKYVNGTLNRDDAAAILHPPFAAAASLYPRNLTCTLSIRAQLKISSLTVSTQLKTTSVNATSQLKVADVPVETQLLINNTLVLSKLIVDNISIR